MEDVKSILVASERLFGCASDPAEMMRQTRIVTEVCFPSLLSLMQFLYFLTLTILLQMCMHPACSNSCFNNSQRSTFGDLALQSAVGFMVGVVRGR